MKAFMRLKKVEESREVNVYTYKDDSSICLECGGYGYSINDNHYLADNDYQRRYLICRNCNGTGRHYFNVDNH